MTTKKYLYIGCLSLLTTMQAGCNDSFLDKAPIDKLTDKTAFVPYETFQTNGWSLYSVFTYESSGRWRHLPSCDAYFGLPIFDA